jgi:chitodextrinase
VQYRNPLRGLTRLDAVRKRWLVWSVVAWVVSGVVVPCVNAAERRASVPPALIVQAQSTSIRIAWDANPVADNVSGYVAGYAEVPSNTTVCPTSGEGDTFIPVGPDPLATAFTIPGLVPLKTYCVRVYAVNVNGRSSASNTVGPRTIAPVPDTVPPSAPTGLIATAASESRVNLSWQPSTDTNGIASYQILEQQVLVATVSGTLTTHSITGLPPASQHIYSVRAVDAAGNMSTESAPASVTTLGDTTAPSIPGNLTATVMTTSACLTWSAATDNIAVQGYRIVREGALPALTSGLNFCENGLTPNTAYLYSVTSFDHAANHSIPATVTATTQALPAPCVTNGKTYAITIANVNYPKVIGRGSRDRVLFDLANSFPVSRVQVLLGAQVVGEAPIGGAILPGVDLRDIPGLRFSAPAVAGNHNLFVRATDNQGCTTTTTLIRPLVVQ